MATKKPSLTVRASTRLGHSHVDRPETRKVIAEIRAGIEPATAALRVAAAEASVTLTLTTEQAALVLEVLEYRDEVREGLVDDDERADNHAAQQAIRAALGAK